jgi:hypothetical protein
MQRFSRILGLGGRATLTPKIILKVFLVGSAGWIKHRDREITEKKLEACSFLILYSVLSVSLWLINSKRGAAIFSADWG